LEVGAVLVLGPPFFYPVFERSGGQAVAEYQVLDHLLGGPLMSVVAGMDLRSLRIQLTHLTGDLAYHPFQNRVHTGQTSWDCFGKTMFFDAEV
jgi:hypothetical protein